MPTSSRPAAHRVRRSAIIIVAAVAIPLLESPPAAAVTRSWVTSTSGAWADPVKWSLSVVPATNDLASISVSPAAPVVITFNTNYTSATALLGLTLDSTSLNPVTLVQDVEGFDLYVKVGGAEEIAPNGRATFVQSASTNSSSSLVIGVNAGSTGTYSLSGTGVLSVTHEYVGLSGTGNFSHSAGTNAVGSQLEIGSNAGSTGTYSLSGTGSFSAFNLYVGGGNSGGAGTGYFFHSAGASTIGSTLYLGYLGGATGTYALSDTGSLSVVNVNVGFAGAGSFVQSGGSHSVSGTLTVGNLNTSTGTYTLSAGSLSTATTSVANQGTGEFVQSGGAHTVSGSLNLARVAGHTGSYALSGGTLSTPALYVGGSSTGPGGAGSLSITGGSATVTGTLKLYNTLGSSLTLAGGTLSVGALDLSENASDFAWSAGTLHFPGGYTIDPSFPLGSVLGLSGNMSLSAGAPSTNAGTIVLGAGSALAGTGTLINAGLISVTGPATVSAPFANSATGILVLPAAATLTLTQGLPINAGLITLAGGTLDNSNHPLTNTGVISGHGALANLPALTNDGSIAVLGGPLTLAGSLSGAGSLYVDPSSSLAAPGGLSQSLLTARGSVSVDSPSTLATLTLDAPTGSFDIASTALTLTATPVALIRQYLHDNQLTSSTPDPNDNHSLGYLASGPTTLVRLTLTGDANLDGKLDADDFTLTDKGFAANASTWWLGDFNYDGQVTPADYLLLDSTYLKNNPPSPSFLATRESQFGATYVSELLAAIPEPSCLSPILYPLSSLFLRRRR